MTGEPGRSLDDAGLADVYTAADRALAEHRARFPGEASGRQPVHTLYVPADRFSRATAREHGREARRLLDAHAPDGAALADGAGLALAGEEADRVRERVAAKLALEPVEDLRIDFEDGYGRRDDAEEDAHAQAAGAAAAAAWRAGELPAFFGVRVKSFADGMARRSVRTLDRFLTALLAGAEGQVLSGFAVTVPKVIAPAHVASFAEVLARLEAALGLDDRALRFEVQIETPQSVLAPDGRAALPGLIDAAGGRMSAAHVGVFDYSAALGLPPSSQRLDHPALDFARHVLQVSAAGTGIRLADGSTNATPASDAAHDVRAVWRLHAAHVAHSLRHGYWQGWDLHPAHLVSRYAAVYAFLLDGFDAVVERLRRWSHDEASPGVADEPATAQALLAHVRRAVACGAADAADVALRTGLAAQDVS